jgi:hypothetical protein
VAGEESGEFLLHSKLEWVDVSNKFRSAFVPYESAQYYKGWTNHLLTTYHRARVCDYLAESNMQEFKVEIEPLRRKALIGDSMRIEYRSKSEIDIYIYLSYNDTCIFITSPKWWTLLMDLSSY